MFKSVDEIFLLTIMRSSGGNFVSSTGESIAPYDVGSTPRDLKLRRCNSVVSHRRLSSLRLWYDATGSAFNRVSMCLEMMRGLLPNL